MAWNWNWRWPGRAGGGPAVPERKSAGFVALHASGDAHWTRRDYAALAREGFMRNPVAHRSVRLIAETAAAIPWLLYDGTQELDDHPLLDLLERPNQRQAGATFLETLYGHLMISGNAYVERIVAGADARELHLLRPDRVSILTDAGPPRWSTGKGAASAGSNSVRARCICRSSTRWTTITVSHRWKPR